MKIIRTPIVIVFVLLLVFSIAASADTPKQDAPSTLVLQCGTVESAEFTPAVSTPQPEKASKALASPVASPPTPVPEPSTVGFLGLGGLCLGLMRLARRKA
jgi:hypothetical protein